MTRILTTLSLLAFSSANLFGLARVPVNCNVGAQQVTVATIHSTTLAPRSIPGATITIYVTSSAQLATALYTSGATVTGTTGQYVNVAFAASISPGGTQATGTLALTGTNTIAANASITIVAPGGYAAAPSTATITSGTATVTGGPLTIQVNTTIGSPAKATIYSDNNLTALANPFTADSYASGFFYAPDGNYDVSCTGSSPLPYTFGGVPADDVYFQQPGAPMFDIGSVVLTEKRKLAQFINAMDYGVVCDANNAGTTGTDNAANIRSAIAAVLIRGGGRLYFPHVPGPNNYCGFKSSLVLATSGGTPITIDADNPAAGGLVALTGGTWTTYTSEADSASHTFGISYGTPGCVSANAFVIMQNFYFNPNYQVDTGILNPCSQEQSGIYNALIANCLFACVEVGYFGVNSEYDLLNLNAGLSSYGFIDGAALRASIRRSTFQGSGSSKSGLLVLNGFIETDDMHCEQFAICTEVKGGSLLANTPSCYGALNSVCIQVDATAVGMTEHNLLCSTCGGVIVKDYLNNFNSNISGFSTVSGFSLGYYSSWKDIGQSATMLISSSTSVPWLAPASITSPAAQFNNSLAFGLNGATPGSILGLYNNGFTNCADTHNCFYVQGDQALHIQRYNQSGAGTNAGGGLSILGNGNSNSPSVGMIGTNFYGNDATAVAASGSGSGTAASLLFNGGSWALKVAIGLTAGSNITWVTSLQASVNGVQIISSAFSALPASVPAVGTQYYCTNCTLAATCTSGGSGHMAVSNGTNWTCQ